MDLTQQIKAINLADTVRSHTNVELRRVGGNRLLGLCPLHNERTPSFTVYEDNHFRCFGKCGAHGDAVDFVQALYGIDFKVALRLLGIERGALTSADYEAIRQREQQRDRARKAKERERDLAYTLAFMIRSSYRALADITQDNMDDYAVVLNRLPWLEHCHDVLYFGSDKQKLTISNGLKDMATIKRNRLFKPGFRVGG